MKTDNELIAEFMGDFVVLQKRPRHWIGGSNLKPYKLIDSLKYDKSWDWLMPVVEKIDKLTPPMNFPEGLELLKNNCHPAEKFMEVTSLPISEPIDEVYQKVVEFIKWYNSQNPKP